MFSRSSGWRNAATCEDDDDFIGERGNVVLINPKPEIQNEAISALPPGTSAPEASLNATPGEPAGGMPAVRDA